MKKINYQNISEYLLEKIPEFRSDFNEYFKNQHGENLQHVLFGDFTRFFVRKYYESQQDIGAKEVVLRCAELIEEMLEQQNLDLKGLVLVSFLENLYDPKEAYYQGIKSYLKPKTLELLKVVEK